LAGCASFGGVSAHHGRMLSYSHAIGGARRFRCHGDHGEALTLGDDPDTYMPLLRTELPASIRCR
jgi:hypothetical protein